MNGVKCESLIIKHKPGEREAVSECWKDIEGLARADETEGGTTLFVYYRDDHSHEAEIAKAKAKADELGYEWETLTHYTYVIEPIESENDA